MGKNYYLRTSDKLIADLIGNYTEISGADHSYQIHLGKRSGGWLPLLQASPGIRSVADMECFCTMNKTSIYDEYGHPLTWIELKEELIYWNGGFDGAIAKTTIEQDTASPFFDSNMPNHVPVSHFEYGNGVLIGNKTYFKDPDGWEFCELDFS